MSLLRDFLNAPKNFKELFEALAKGDFSKAISSYGKTVPMATMVAFLGQPVANKVAKSLTTNIFQPGAAEIVSAGIKKVGSAASSAAKWWLAPAKAAGYKLVAPITGKVAAKGAKGAVAGIIKPIVITGAVTAAEHGLSRLIQSPSMIDVGKSLVKGKVDGKALELLRRETKWWDYPTGSFLKRGVLKLIDQFGRKSDNKNLRNLKLK
jgi:hypothetical protein